MKTEFIRRIDKLGRIVIPIDLRDAFEWDIGTEVVFLKQDKSLIIQTHHNKCCACGNKKDIIPLHEKHICRSCIDIIKS